MRMDHLIILKALVAKGMKQDEIARQLDTSQPQVARWLKGQVPSGTSIDAIRQLGREHGIISEDYEQKAGETVSAPRDFIPEIDLVAGLGGGGLAAIEQTSRNGITFAKEVVRDHWRLPDWMLSRLNVKSGHVAAFPCQGDSMTPTIGDGDVVFVDTRHRVPSPPGLYALADEFGGVVVKRLEVTSRPADENVTVSVSSDNPRHMTRELNLSEIHIIGRYIGRFTV